MHESFGNLGGVICYGNKELIKFKFIEDVIQYCDILVENPLPYVFGACKDDRALRAFLEERLIPRSRHLIDSDLKQTPIEYYDPERLIRYSSGRCVADPYWIKCDNDKTCGMDFSKIPPYNGE